MWSDEQNIKTITDEMVLSQHFVDFLNRKLQRDTFLKRSA
jgi:hypothetical protein